MIFYVFLKRLCASLCLVIFLASVLQANKTRRVFLTADDFLKGEYENTFVNEKGQLQLSMSFAEVLNIDEELIWEIYVDEQKIALAVGGEKGGAYLYDYDANAKQIGERLFFTNIASTEMVSIAKDEYGAFYFGSGGEGKIFRLSADAKDFQQLLALSVDFVWDLHYDEKRKRFYAATGSEKAEVHQFSVSKEGALQDSKLLDSFEQPNATKLMVDENFLYIATSDQGKLYRMLLDGDASSTVFYDALYKDISDFFIDGDFIYLSTAGQDVEPPGLGGENTNPPVAKFSGEGRNFDRQTAAGVAQDALNDFEQSDASMVDVEEAMAMDEDEGENGDEGPSEEGPPPPSSGHQGPPSLFENKVLQIHKKTGVTTTLAIFSGANVLAIGKINALNKAYGNLPRDGIVLYIALVENGQVFTLDTREQLPRLLHYDEKVGLSSIAQHGGEIFLASQSGAAVYRLGSKLPEQGQFTTQVIDLDSILRYGKVEMSHYSENEDVDVYMRGGPQYNVDETWSEWALFHSENAQKNLESSKQGDEESDDRVSRFVQFSLVLKNRGDVSPKMGALVFSYAAPNTPPLIKNLQLRQNFSERNGPPGNHQSLSSTPGKLGLLSRLKNVPASSKYTLSWNAVDRDNDLIRYDIYYREKSEKAWRPLLEKHFQPFLVFDTGLFLDGLYQFKVVYSDEPNNAPNQSFKRDAVSDYLLIDHTIPIIDVHQEGTMLYVKVSDKWSAITGLLYTFGDDTYYELAPDDGVFEEIEENFSLALPKDQDQIMFIARDNSNNFAVKSFRTPKQ